MEEGDVSTIGNSQLCFLKRKGKKEEKLNLDTFFDAMLHICPINPIIYRIDLINSSCSIIAYLKIKLNEYFLNMIGCIQSK